MSISIDPIHLRNFFTTVSNNFVGQLNDRIVRVVENTSHYMRYNELTLAGSTILINLGFIILAEKIMQIAPQKLQFANLEKAWVRHTAVLLFKGAVAGAGLSGANYLFKLQLTHLLIGISVISSLALQLLFENVFIPMLDAYGTKAKTEASAVKGKETGVAADSVVEDKKKEVTENAAEVFAKPDEKMGHAAKKSGETDKDAEKIRTGSSKESDELATEEEIDPSKFVPTEEFEKEKSGAKIGDPSVNYLATAMVKGRYASLEELM